MISNITYTTIGEIADVKGGKRLKKGKVVQQEVTDHPYIRVVDFREDGFDSSKVKYITDDAYRDVTRYTITSDDIYVSIAGTVGRVGIIPPSFSGANLTENAAKITNISHEFNKRFLVYYLRSEFGQNEISSKIVGTSKPKLALFRIKEIRIPRFATFHQQRIAAIFSAYDDLLENNLRRIKILEEMAQTIYREWFVKLRFPGYQKVKMVDSPLGKIPDGWRIDLLGNMTSVIIKGTTPTTLGKAFTESGINFIKVESIENSGALLENKFAKIDTETHKLLGRSQLCVDDILFSIAGAIGRVAIVPERILPANTNQALAIIRPSMPKFISYLFWVLRSSDFLNFSLGRVVQTAQANVSLTILKSAPVVVPTDDILDQFSGMIDPIRRLIDGMLAKNMNLRQTRDLLLPKLIFGELDVSELDITIPEADE